ncbi:MAG: hypothetical protein IJA47_03560 [Oscillospiraceae bacterium]|nr:hypothetical protein [Oscillospiraceae bacterium]
MNKDDKRLIDADALLGELDKFANPMPNKSGYDFLCGVATIITEIENAPAVDAVEVVHGKWISADYKPHIYRKCSKCGQRITVGKESNYCPNCGAKMDGGNEDA